MTAVAPDVTNTLRVRTEGIAVHYNHETKLELPDVSVAQGEELVLIGPSGSGKTTLLHVLAGLLRPSKGKVWVAGSELTSFKEGRLERFRAQNIGVVFQDFHLVEGYSALDNVVVALAAAGYDFVAAKRRASQLLEELGVAHRLKHPPKRLSTGERQRVAIARAVAANPVVLLADEPTANLDRGRAEAALHLLREAARNVGAALVVSTHDPLVKDSFATRIELS